VLSKEHSDLFDDAHIEVVSTILCPARPSAWQLLIDDASRTTESPDATPPPLWAAVLSAMLEPRLSATRPKGSAKTAPPKPAWQSRSTPSTTTNVAAALT